MLEINILPMEKKHIEQIAIIEKECFSKPWSEKMIEVELYKEVSNFLVAVNQDKVVGYIGLHIISDQAYIANIAVLKEYRKQKVATKLLQTAEGLSIAYGANFITLEVRKSNKEAISLYKKEDYKIAGNRKNFYTNPQEDAVIFTKVF